MSNSAVCDPERSLNLVPFLKNYCSVMTGYDNYYVRGKNHIIIPVKEKFKTGCHDPD